MFTTNVLKFKEDVGSKVYFTSDTHFGHQRSFIYERRGHTSVTEHDEKCVESINEHVRENDLLFHLGDFCLNTNRPRFDEILDSINCKNIFYIWGNHNAAIKEAYREVVDSMVSGLSFNSDIQVYPVTYKNKLTFLGPYQEISVNKKLIVLSHYPIEIWNQQQKNVWHICGHSHHGNPTTLPDSTSGLCLDAGWDGYYRPISFEEVSYLMSKKTYLKKDTHH